MSCLPKPVLRGHAKRYGVKTVVGGVIFAAINGALYHYLVALPKQVKFEEYYKNYDGEAHYKRLVECGYLKSYSN